VRAEALSEEVERLTAERDAWKALATALRHPKRGGAKRARRLLEKLGVPMSETGPIGPPPCDNCGRP
jgi:hypothetical protein